MCRILCLFSTSLLLAVTCVLEKTSVLLFGRYFIFNFSKYTWLLLCPQFFPGKPFVPLATSLAFRWSFCFEQGGSYVHQVKRGWLGFIKMAVVFPGMCFHVNIQTSLGFRYRQGTMHDTFNSSFHVCQVRICKWVVGKWGSQLHSKLLRLLCLLLLLL